jgi:hypothetical protein
MRLNDQGKEVMDKGTPTPPKKEKAFISDLNAKESIVRIRPVHHELLRAWYAARGRQVDTSTFSDCGFIVDGRIAGFLYVTNSNMAFIEGVIADPYTVPSLRRHSMKKLIGILIDTATMLGYDNIFGISRHPSMSKLGKEFGFKEEPFNVLMLSTDKD